MLYFSAALLRQHHSFCLFMSCTFRLEHNGGLIFCCMASYGFFYTMYYYFLAFSSRDPKRTFGLEVLFPTISTYQQCKWFVLFCFFFFHKHPYSIYDYLWVIYIFKKSSNIYSFNAMVIIKQYTGNVQLSMGVLSQ